MMMTNPIKQFGTRDVDKLNLRGPVKSMDVEMAQVDGGQEIRRQSARELLSRTTFDALGRTIESEEYLQAADHLSEDMSISSQPAALVPPGTMVGAPLTPAIPQPRLTKSVYRYRDTTDLDASEVSHFGADGQLIGKSSASVGSDKRVRLFEQVDLRGELDDRWTVTRNETGAIAEILYETGNGTPGGNEHWQYDVDGKPVAYQSYRDDGSAATSDFEYDGAIQTETSRTVRRSEMCTETIEREHDELGRVTWMFLGNEDAGSEMESKFTYDEFGDLVEQKTCASEIDSTDITRFEYERDRAGNWTRRAQYMQYGESSPPELTEVQYRTITYYDEG